MAPKITQIAPNVISIVILCFADPQQFDTPC